MPDNESIINNQSYSFISKKNIYIGILILVVFLLLALAIILNKKSSPSPIKNNPTATPIPSPVKASRLKSLMGLVKSVDLKNNTLTITHDKVAETFLVGNDASINQINPGTPTPNLKVTSWPIQKLTLKDLKAGLQVLVAFKEGQNQQVALIQVYK